MSVAPGGQNLSVNTDTVVAYENAQVARRIFKLYLDIACVGVTEGI